MVFYIVCCGWSRTHSSLVTFKKHQICCVLQVMAMGIRIKPFARIDRRKFAQLGSVDDVYKFERGPIRVDPNREPFGQLYVAQSDVAGRRVRGHAYKNASSLRKRRE